MNRESETESRRDGGGLDLGEAPDLLETLAHRLERDHIRARLFGGPAEPVRVGRFVLERPLSAGSMGVIYIAQDEQLRRPVALKLLRSQAGAPTQQSRLLDEAQTMARLSHPNVATVYEAGTWEGRVYMAMELVRGRTLRQWLAQSRRDDREIVDVFVQAGLGLAAAHEEGLVHRDFKPDNVMVGNDGRVRVVDFGLACAESTAALGSVHGGPIRLLHSTQAIAGTPAYMAPEQYRGEDIDARADIFAFCVSLHEALYGARPFAGETIAEIQANIVAGAVSRHRKKKVVWLDEMIRKGLSARRDDRYPSMHALVAELRKERPSRFRAWTAAVAVALAAIGWGVVAFTRAPEAGAPPSRPARPPEAIAAYERAMTNQRTGGPVLAELVRAVELDPSYTEAHLQMLAGPNTYITQEMRDRYGFIKPQRETLTPYEQALFDTMEPIFGRERADWAEGARRALVALERFPKKPQLWAQLAEYETHLGAFESALAHHDRALVEEPGFAESASARGSLLVSLGRLDEGREALERCVFGGATAAVCTAHLLHWLADEGRCDRMEAVARHASAMGVLGMDAQWFLATSLAGQGKSIAAVLEAARWAADHKRQPLGIPARNILRYKVAFYAGEFEEAEREADEVARLAEETTDGWIRTSAVVLRSWLYLETGREAEAARSSKDWLDRKDAWLPLSMGDDLDVLEDLTPFLIAAAYRGGLLNRQERSALRDAWIATKEAHLAKPYRYGLWINGYGSLVDSPESAKEALDALPTYGPLPAVELKSFGKSGLGVAYLLQGRPADAIAVLERATRSCRGLMVPYEHTRAFAWLGRAYQEIGDVKAACAAYRVVLDRWGHGRSRSTTSEQIREWMRGISCPG